MVVLLVGTGALVRSHANAATSVLGPTACVKAGNQGSIGLEYTSEGVANSTGVPTEVICSLFRDNTTNTNGMQDLEIAIRDPNPTAGVLACTAFSYDRNGVIKKSLEKRPTTVGNVIIDWGSAINVSVSRGYYTIRCMLPVNAIVRSIFYTEP
jgi:hypothetical protein